MFRGANEFGLAGARHIFHLPGKPVEARVNPLQAFVVSVRPLVLILKTFIVFHGARIGWQRRICHGVFTVIPVLLVNDFCFSLQPFPLISHLLSAKTGLGDTVPFSYKKGHGLQLALDLNGIITLNMTEQPLPLDQQEHRAIVGICILAAFADAMQSEDERARIQQIVNGFSGDGLDVATVYQDVLGGKLPLATAASRLQTPSARALAYEMAVCVCNADGVVNDAERKFLADLHQALRLDASATDEHQQTAQALATQTPVIAAPPILDVNRDAELDKMILNAAILNGALEIMPHTLATMAIVPLQMRLVYRVGKAYGYELERGHIKDFLATVGVGLTSQVVEGFTRQLIGGFSRRLAGRFLGGLVGQAAGSAVAFASTYALGQVARRYYASGRTLSAAQLKDVFSAMLANGRSLQCRYSGDILHRSRQVNVTELLPLARNM
jgi:uncharacterized protein (DUF697 family)/uncharacterized membrane protein YebE (DUF533 family)